MLIVWVLYIIRGLGFFTPFALYTPIFPACYLVAISCVPAGKSRPLGVYMHGVLVVELLGNSFFSWDNLIFGNYVNLILV